MTATPAHGATRYYNEHPDNKPVVIRCGDFGERICQPKKGRWEMQQRTETRKTLSRDSTGHHQVETYRDFIVNEAVCVDPDEECDNWIDVPSHVVNHLKTGRGQQDGGKFLKSAHELGIAENDRLRELAKERIALDAELAVLRERNARARRGELMEDEMVQAESAERKRPRAGYKSAPGV